jgi:hypothetical protein
MRKALIPMVASLVLCGAGTAALIASNERAQANPRKPMMVALLGDFLVAQNLPDTPPAPGKGMSGDFTPNPRQICDDRYAGEVGRMAYLEARLHLGDSQQPLFARWKEVRLDIAKRRAADCSVHGFLPGQEQADPVERMKTEEDMLRQRAADLAAERPVFAALYAAMAPDQRQTLAPPRPMMARDHGPMPPPRAMGGLPPPPPPPVP